MWQLTGTQLGAAQHLFGRLCLHPGKQDNNKKNWSQLSDTGGCLGTGTGEWKTWASRGDGRESGGRGSAHWTTPLPMPQLPPCGRSVRNSGGRTVPTTPPASRAARASASTRPRLALTSALTPPAPFAPGARRRAGLTLPLRPAEPRPPRSLLSPTPARGQAGGTDAGRYRAGPATRPGGRSRPASRPWPEAFPPPGMRLPPHRTPVYCDISPLPQPRPLQGWVCPGPAGSPRPGGAPRAWGGVLLRNNSLFQGRVSSPIFQMRTREAPRT